MDEIKTQADMAWKYGSRDGVNCWCGNQQANGLTHQKVFHPISCGSEKCKELQAKYNALPEGKPEEWDNIFGG